MSKWIIFSAIFLWGCGIRKEKTRLKTDSLSQLQISAQWQLINQRTNNEYQLKDSSSLMMVLIKADAPFKWQIDSGLTARAGNYELYLVKQGKSISAKKQLVQQDENARVSIAKKEASRTVAEKKEVLKAPMKWKLILFLSLLFVVGFVLVRWNKLRVAS